MRIEWNNRNGRAGRSSPNSFYAILAVMLVVGLAWILWHTGHSKTTTPPSLPPRENATRPPLIAPPVPGRDTVPPMQQRPPPAPVKATQPAPTNAIPASVTNAPRPKNIRITPLPELDKPLVSPAMSVIDAQIMLARQGICSGSIDGALGTQTRAAIRAFQRREGLPITGSLDAETRARLIATLPLQTGFVVSSNDLARLQPVKTTWLGKSDQTALDYESILEFAAEKGHSHPALIRKLNPGIAWSNVIAGQRITIPQVEYPNNNGKAALVRIHLEEKSLEVFNAQSNLLAHFPCSIAARVEKRPVGELHVKTVAWNPNYTFDPAVFPESAEGRELGRKLLIPPGPNNPVGVAWIGLDRPGYGIHGTPRPEDVGRTESHGCFRLANWNAEFLVRMVRPGIPVVVEP